MHDLPPFPGFRPAAFQFLRDLRANNDREWFKPRKATYEDELKDPLELLVADFAREAAHRGLALTGDPRRSPFRIYRDTRFSKNKAPYKTHVSAVLSRDGSRKADGMLYVHVEPDTAFVGGGFWRPDTPLLRRLRERIAGDPDGFLAMADELARSGLTFQTNESLKRMPRGYEDFAESPVADYLRWKSFYAERTVTEAELSSPAFTQRVADTAEELLPLLEWGWAVVDGVPEDAA